MAQSVTLASGIARTRPLGEFRARELRGLLDSETEHWSRELLWDYADVSSAVASGLDRQTLTGRVLQLGSDPIAYCYYLQDGDRAIVGSLFARPEFRGRGYEEQLLLAVLSDAQADSCFQRVECQTLFSTARDADGCFRRAGFTSSSRHYLIRSLRDSQVRPGPRLRRLRRSDLDAAAEIIHRSHEGSIDAALNTTYSTRDHCRHFVETLVLRSGCGRFDGEASLVAEGRAGLEGVLLASQLSSDNGHICQVSVDPLAEGRGIGTALVSAALAAFEAEGLSVASLSVTVGNERARRLYASLGFRMQRAFAAHAWARAPGCVSLPR